MTVGIPLAPPAYPWGMTAKTKIAGAAVSGSTGIAKGCSTRATSHIPTPPDIILYKALKRPLLAQTSHRPLARKSHILPLTDSL